MNAQTKVELPALARLREPFPAHQISKLPKPTKQQTEAVRRDFKKGVRCKECGAWHHPDVVHLDYVGHAALTDRLLDTDPNWFWEPVAFTPEGLPAFDGTGGLWIKLTICGVTRYGYGHAAAKPNQDPGSREKEVIGDALRNAAMRFGAALDLWHKGDLHAEDDDGNAASAAPAKQQAEGMPDDEWAKLANLLRATGVRETALLKEYKVQNLRKLDQRQYADAIERLNAKLAEKAKAETNNQAFGELIDDEIPY